MDCILCGSWFCRGSGDKACPACERAMRQLRIKMPVDRLCEIVRAERDGRLSMMPFKVGDTVYRVATTSKYVNSKKNASYIKKIKIKPENAHKYTSGIGETVFLTRDAAEAELERRIGGNDGKTD